MLKSYPSSPFLVETDQCLFNVVESKTVFYSVWCEYPKNRGLTMTLGKIFICLTFVEIQFSSVGIEANRGQSLGKHKSISGQTTALQQQLDAVQFTLYSDLCSLIKFLKGWFVQFLCQTTALASCMMYIIQKRYVHSI